MNKWSLSFKGYFFCFCLWMAVFPLYAWNAVGHMVIGQIAFDQLSVAKQQRVIELIHYLDEVYPVNGYLIATYWADQIRSQGITEFNRWHYSNQPYSADGTPTRPPHADNIVWAIQEGMKVLQDHKASLRDKSFHLRMLLHLVGDVHQPLHCINRFSRETPFGDRGGNDYPVQAANAENLHQLWDRGLNVWANYFTDRPLASWQIKQISKQLQKKYAFSAWLTEDQYRDDVQLWADQCHQLAVEVAYQLSRGGKLTVEYRLMGQETVEQQVLLAGYRLGYWLEKLL